MIRTDTDVTHLARLRSARSPALSGRVRAPGDKSISHRAVLFGALAEGETIVHGLLEGEDVLRTAAAVRALGAEAERALTPDGPVWCMTGAQWAPPVRALYMGNSGTGARLLMGAVAGAHTAAAFEGDASLRARPMRRILDPLAQMGAHCSSADGRLPARVDGRAGLRAVAHRAPRASAQIKSAVLLAGLGADGETRVIEPAPSRDHTERMLRAFGVPVREEMLADGAHLAAVQGGARLRACTVRVPGDPSSAAFPAVAVLVTPGSEIVIEGVLVNPLRTGLYETLVEMGADIAFENPREEGEEPIADLRVRASRLKGVRVPAARAPSMIDEYPILAVAAAFAEGETLMEGLAELRVKESDRLDATAALLAVCGVKAQAGPDWLRVTGGRAAVGGATVRTHMDHRIAMAALVLGLAADGPVAIDDAATIATSFPGFADLMRGLGADIAAA